MLKLKKRVKNLFAIFLVLSLMVTCSAFSVDFDNRVSPQKIEKLQENILEVSRSVEGTQYKEVIRNVDLLRDEIKAFYPLMNDYELGKVILMSLGDSAEFVASLPEEKVLEALEYTSVTRSEVYLRELPDGELEEISRELFYSLDPTTCSSDIPNYAQPLGDIILRSTAYEHNPVYGKAGRKYYAVRGEVEWVGNPNFIFNDVLVVSSTGNIDNEYQHAAYGEWTSDIHSPVYDSGFLYDRDGGDGDFLVLTTPSLFGMGTEFPLLVYSGRDRIIKNVCAYYGVSAQSDISCRVSYAHGIIAWDPSFSVDLGGSVSFGGNSLQREVFHGDAFTLYYD